METLRFGETDVENVLARMDPAEIDDLAFGIVRLDKDGKIMLYNKAEGEIVGRDPRDMVGKNFFVDVAPCTNRPEFFGRFRDGVKSGNLQTTFEYVFTHQAKPLTVIVQMKEMAGFYWVLIKRA